MAEQAASGSSSPGTDTDDADFDPTADMLVHDDYDDERTLDEEEAASNEESVADELNDLQKEGDMPLEELLAMYGCGRDQLLSIPAHSDNTPSSSQVAADASSSSSSGGGDDGVSSVDLAVVGNGGTDDGSGADPLNTSRLLRSDDIGESSSDEDEDYDPENDEYWKKSIQVGSEYQAIVPDGLTPYGTTQVYENDDRLLWDPSKLADAVVEQYIAEIHRHNRANCEGVYTIPTGAHIRDDEQALYLLLQCSHDVEEALRRHRLQSIPPTDPMSLWSEEECRNFENGLRTYGKDFFQIQLNRVRTRSVGELVQFYYLWKKTERHDAFAARTRMEKKRYAMHPGITDYMDRFLDDQENPSSTMMMSTLIATQSASPLPQSVGDLHCTPSNSDAIIDQSAVTSHVAVIPSEVTQSITMSVVSGSVDTPCVPNSIKLCKEPGHTTAGSFGGTVSGHFIESEGMYPCSNGEVSSMDIDFPEKLKKEQIYNCTTDLSGDSAILTSITSSDVLKISSEAAISSVSRSDTVIPTSKRVVFSAECGFSDVTDTSLVSESLGTSGCAAKFSPAQAEPVNLIPTQELQEICSSEPSGLVGGVVQTLCQVSAIDSLCPPSATIFAVEFPVDSLGRMLPTEGVKPMEGVVECPPLSADLTDIPVDSLVPPVDHHAASLTADSVADVDPMDVSVDSLVPLIENPDSSASATLGGLPGSSDMNSLVTFGPTPFPAVSDGSTMHSENALPPDTAVEVVSCSSSDMKSESITWQNADCTSTGGNNVQSIESDVSTSIGSLPSEATDNNVEFVKHDSTQSPRPILVPVSSQPENDTSVGNSECVGEVADTGPVCVENKLFVAEISDLTSAATDNTEQVQTSVASSENFKAELETGEVRSVTAKEKPLSTGKGEVQDNSAPADSATGSVLVVASSKDCKNSVSNCATDDSAKMPSTSSFATILSDCHVGSSSLMS